MWAFLSTWPMGTAGGSGASKLSKLEVSRGFLSMGLIGAGRVLLTMACQSSRLNHLCCLISVAPVGPDPSRLSGLTYSPRHCWIRVLGGGVTHAWERRGSTTRRAVRRGLNKAHGWCKLAFCSGSTLRLHACVQGMHFSELLPFPPTTPFTSVSCLTGG